MRFTSCNSYDNDDVLQPIELVSGGARENSQRAAKSIEDLSRWAVGTSRLDTLGHPLAFSLWVAARVSLVHASALEAQMSPDIGVFVSILSTMGRRWRAAKRYGEILESRWARRPNDLGYPLDQ